MKILLSAYSCLPTDGSEPGIGWNWARCIAANGHQVVAMTRTTNRPSIESHLERFPAERLRFIYHDLPRTGQLLYSVPLGNYIYYLLWQYTAAKLASTLHRSERFDRVQHITWGSFRVPSFMGRLGIPFTFGPVGGGEDTPRNLRRGLGWRGRLWDALRRISIVMTAPWMGSTFKSASEIVATTQETLEKVPQIYRHKSWSRQAVGIDPGSVRRQGSGQAAPRRQNSSRLELLFVGRLLPWKGLHLVLKALAQLGASQSAIHLTVIGSGSDGSRLRRMARRLKLDGMVSWRPWMPRNELIRVYSQFDLFTFPSLHDSGGMVVLEALTFGLPVVCLDVGGPAMAVDDRCGRVIATRNRDEDGVVQDMAHFLAGIMADRDSLDRLSESARARAASLTWQANVDAVYRDSAVLQAS
jgi:glycosyltransferase involved in cell wall biosynthesis